MIDRWHATTCILDSVLPQVGLGVLHKLLQVELQSFLIDSPPFAHVARLTLKLLAQCGHRYVLPRRQARIKLQDLEVITQYNGSSRILPQRVRFKNFIEWVGHPAHSFFAERTTDSLHSVGNSPLCQAQKCKQQLVAYPLWRRRTITIINILTHR